MRVYCITNSDVICCTAFILLSFIYRVYFYTGYTDTVDSRYTILLGSEKSLNMSRLSLYPV